MTKPELIRDSLSSVIIGYGKYESGARYCQPVHLVHEEIDIKIFMGREMVENTESGKLVIEVIEPGCLPIASEDCTVASTNCSITEICLPYLISMDEMAHHRNFWITRADL